MVSVPATNGTHATHQAQKKRVQDCSYSCVASGASENAYVSIVQRANFDT